MRKILFFAHDPGGANAIKPLILPLMAKGFECFIYGKGPALFILPNVAEYAGNTDELIKNVKPNFIITGTSAKDMTEKELRKSAHKHGILCLAILDFWVNYNRFTKYSTKELAKNKRYNELDYLPDFLIVMDTYAKDEASKQGVPKELMHPLGNPHFRYIKDCFDALDVSGLRSSLLKGKQKLILWASEPHTNNYGLECLKDLIEYIPDNARLLIKPHPREKLDKFEKIARGGGTIIKNISSLQAIKISDLIVSITSMVLLESIIVNKSALSYQKYETNPNKFILTKRQILPFINDEITLKNELQRALKFNSCVYKNVDLNFNATENIIKFIEDRLCQN